MHIHFDTAVETAVSVYKHHLAAAAQKVSGKSDEDVMLSIWGWEAQFRQSCAKFVFDTYPTDAMDFGLDLMREQMFALPFERCYFEWTYKGCVTGLFAWYGPGYGEDFMHLWHASQLTGGGWGASMQWGVRLKQLADHLATGKSVNEYDQKWGKAGYPGKGASIEEIATVVSAISAKGVPKEAVTVRPAINAKRERQGKRPLPEYTIIRLSHCRKSPAGSGTHASPRPHMRRGHIRRLDETRKTIVRPHFVMADPGALPTYRIPASHE